MTVSVPAAEGVLSCAILYDDAGRWHTAVSVDLARLYRARDVDALEMAVRAAVDNESIAATAVSRLRGRETAREADHDDSCAPRRR